MKKGFTLVEILVVIGLIGLIAVVVATNMVGLQGKQTEKQYRNYVDKIETAACTFFEKSDYADMKKECKNNPNSEYCKIKIEQLINSGLIAKDLHNPMEDKDVIEFKEDYVLVSYKNGEKTCVLQEK